MIDWAESGADWVTTIGYARVQLWRPQGKGWHLSIYNHHESFLLRNAPACSLRTRRIDVAKKRACKCLIKELLDHRNTINAWLLQLEG